MGDVIPLFRDRRPQPTPRSKAELHDHLQHDHRWGGPKSSTVEAMKHVHDIHHKDPLWNWIPHSHGEGS